MKSMLELTAFVGLCCLMVLSITATVASIAGLCYAAIGIAIFWTLKAIMVLFGGGW